MDKVDLLKRADDLLKFIIDGLEQGKELAEREAPLLVREVVTWGIVEHVLYAVFALMAFAVAVWVFRWCRREIVKHGSSYCDDGYDVGVILAAIAMIPTALMVVVNVVIATKAAVAPRLYLLGELKQLLK